MTITARDMLCWRQGNSIPDASMRIYADDVKSAKSVRDLRIYIYIDSNMSMITCYLSLKLRFTAG